MLHFQRGALDPRDFWHVAPESFGSATQSDLFIGRNIFGILAAMNLQEITVDYVIVDTLRVPRETFAAILQAWRDGYAESIGRRNVSWNEVNFRRSVFCNPQNCYE